MSQSTRMRLTIDLDALAANYRTLLKEARGAEVAPAVKADAYGLGAERVAARLLAEGARSFFVARLEEGEALRATLGSSPTIYVLDGATAGSARRLQVAELTPVLNSLVQIEEYATGGGGPAALHVDTGMNRLGLREEELRALVASDRLSRLNLLLLMSHLACAGDPENRMSARQVGRIKAARTILPDVPVSLANSAGTFLGDAYHFEMVRPGISLYGGGPFEAPDARIRPVATLEAPILQLRAVPAGETVGYGATYVAPEPIRIAIIAAGYADGLLRSASPGASVWFAGARRRLLGRVSMDLAAIDVSGAADATPGAPVEIFGPNNPIDTVAAETGTIAYELLTRVAPRAERLYLDEPHG